MQKTAISILCLIMMLALGNGAIVSGQSDDDMRVPMGTITIEPPESVEPKRTPVDFPHSLHFTNDCRTCHHKWTGTEQIQSCQTSGCHDVAASPIRSGKKESDEDLTMRYYKTAYHRMCISCHREMKRINKELEMSYKKLDKELPRTGPTGCIQCHPKE